ncbi:MAG: hypothetical protein ACRDR6_09700 [Pseudonocardiaceae bacterium]
MAAGTYTITASQVVTGSGAPSTGGYFGQYAQSFTVRAPQFSLPPGDVGELFPPPDSNGVYGTVLPSVVLNQRALPWARALTGDPTVPWLALLTFQPDEVVLDPATGLPLRTSTVREFLVPDSAVLGPAIDPSGVPADVLAATMSSVVVPLRVFIAVAPTVAELRYLAHVRQTDTADQAESDAAQDGWYAVVIGNRFPETTEGPGVRSLACLVSLEGLTRYLPGGTGNPVPPGGDVKVVVVASWSFVSNLRAGESFGQLMERLVPAAGGDPRALLPRLPVPAHAPASRATRRLTDGYVPLASHLPSGEDTFAWYRGPFSPVMPQPLPAPAGGTGHYATAAELMIYLADQGLFDLSYASAFEAGRLAALGDRAFAVALVTARRASYQTLQTLATRLGSPGVAQRPAAELLAPRLVSRRFGGLLREGMGTELSARLARLAGSAPPAAVPLAVLADPAAAPAPVEAAPAPVVGGDPVAATRALLARDDVRGVLATQVTEGMNTVTGWLAELTLLHGIPFRFLVPDERMLPVESVRFFYVDSGWIAALFDGALSVGVEGSRDLELTQTWSAPLIQAVAVKAGAVRARRRGRPDLVVDTAPSTSVPAGNDTPSTRSPSVADAPPAGVARAGLLLRSAAVAGWPGLVVRADDGATSLLRLDRLSDTVLLALFDKVPTTVTLSEPWHGLRFGVAPGNVIQLRGLSGESLNTTFPAPGHGDIVSSYLRVPVAGVGARVLAVSALATAVGSALELPPGTPMGSAIFATELVQAPQQLTFTVAPPGRSAASQPTRTQPATGR